jgi:hypothetical protein
VRFYAAGARGGWWVQRATESPEGLRFQKVLTKILLPQNNAKL